jgi:hypothetical protein
MPINVRNKVDFPIPLAPIKAINSPFFKVKLMLDAIVFISFFEE